MRLEKLDIFRWIAIILMVIFHLNYSLVNIFGNDIINFSENFWFIIWKIAALLFIFIWGISFFLAENKYWKQINSRYLKVSVILWIIASGITISTHLFFPEQYIKFWIIHFFALSFLLLLFFRKLKYYNVLLWVLTIITGVLFTWDIQNQYLYFLWFTYPWFSSADFYPILPYFWIILLWYSFTLFLQDNNYLNILALHKQKNKTNIKNIFSYYNKILKILWRIWRYSLVIYLVHQPIIIGIIYLYEYTL